MSTIVSLLFVLVSVYAAVCVIRAFTVKSGSEYSSSVGVEGVLVEPGSMYCHASKQARLINS
ncbi:hypothetical protein MD588_10725 [Photobacterium sp. SDRW27]|uniref:hypothetical protein n=1 Tax=Photobacterium obscurum TaxID=2829490 RepID=UPI002243DE02|nr:hypothetical protein [Photobacterium obscurum]MCW8329279.1 hypothetical protein [Photobacterium obscurum]